jgi:hypothetical protein
MIRSIILGMALVFASTASAQSPPIGAVIQTQHYDPAANSVMVRIVNNSHKDITGYNVSIKETYADGRVQNHEMLFDYVGRIVLVQEMKGTPDEKQIHELFGDGLFHAGETRDEMLPVSPNLKDYQAVVDAVAYADQTAEASNKDGLGRLLSHRKAEVASLQAADGIIKTALADPNDTNLPSTAAKKIEDKITVWNAQKHTQLDFEPEALSGVLNDLKAMSSNPNANKRDALSQYAAQKEKRIATLLPHSELTKVGGPQ